ncbi:pyridoxal phosphate-dependent aminotransferase [Haloarculaceae archaeon H-GB2-1]|nr:pyridoxal phosphate-dependent aminotransferase [Haloarculaceae archaeon H-GB1-1]MEA5387896.1 pyridoxal phosphate-dependent aminotransferase [Haloarculaceae archaeon H-GB11]MEA5409389.1 pyridoxal phosphate-dependent aminotransferase [Haloarculaceae archaeon H-GB2-1]
MSTEFAAWMDAVEPSETARMADLASRLRREGADVVGMETADPDFPTPEHVRDAAKAALDRGETGYPPTPGLYDFRAAIAHKLSAENDLPTDPEEVYVTPGSKYALFEAVATLVRAGDEVVIPEPAWVSYEPMVKIAGGVVEPMALDAETGFEPTAADLQSAVSDDTRLFVLNTPSNPTGAVYERETLEALADLAVDHDFWVLADEIYEKLIYDGEHVSIGSLPGMAERTITVNALSKGYAMTGWRLGYITGPQAFVDALGTLQSHSVTSATVFAQRGGIAALEGPREPFEELRETFHDRRDVLVDVLSDAGVDVPVPEGGLSAFVPVGTDDVAFCEALLESDHVATTPGTAFGREGYVRVCLTTDRVEEGIERLARQIA